MKSATNVNGGNDKVQPKKRRSVVIIVVLLLVIGLAMLWPIVRVRQLTASFSKVRAGDTRELVLQRMGNPWKAEVCGEVSGGWAPGCTENLIYAHPYAPYVSQYWVVDLNSEHRVSWKRQVLHLH